jgi:hypothetical protein
MVLMMVLISMSESRDIRSSRIQLKLEYSVVRGLPFAVVDEVYS